MLNNNLKITNREQGKQFPLPLQNLLEEGLEQKQLVGLQTIFKIVKCIYPNMLEDFADRFWTEFSHRN